MSVDTRGEVGQLTFDATQLSSRGAATFRGGSRGRTLLRERIAFGFRFPAQIRESAEALIILSAAASLAASADSASSKACARRF